MDSLRMYLSEIVENLRKEEKRTCTVEWREWSTLIDLDNVSKCPLIEAHA
jgi:hypothetical protein